MQASDGFEALELAIAERPDLLLLDWMMPRLDGPALIEAFRNRPDTRDIPIIMLTTKKEKTDAEWACVLGVHVYLTKPFSPEALANGVNLVLSESPVVGHP